MAGWLGPPNIWNSDDKNQGKSFSHGGHVGKDTDDLTPGLVSLSVKFDYGYLIKNDIMKCIQYPWM